MSIHNTTQCTLLIACLSLLITQGAAQAADDHKPIRFKASKPFAPQLQKISSVTENAHAVGTGAQRVFFPLAAGSIFKNKLSGHKEVLVGGWEQTNANLTSTAFKIYQKGTNQYERVDVPEHLLQYQERPRANPRGVLLQGMGTIGRDLVVAGGCTDTHPARTDAQTSSQVFMINSSTRQVQDLGEMPTSRATPMVTGRGRFIFVGGGIVRESPNQRSNSVALATNTMEIYDRKHQRWMDGKEVDKHFPGLSTLPERRYGGSMVRVNNSKEDRLYVIGGATFGEHDQVGQVLNAIPGKRVDIYDFKTNKWSSTEIPTRRMFPAVASRSKWIVNKEDAKGKCSTKTKMTQLTEILVAGGGTGLQAQRPVDPQLYSVEQLRTKDLSWSFGAHLPVQPALGVATGARMNRPTNYLDWSGNALALNPRCGKECSFFGFSRSFWGVSGSRPDSSASVTESGSNKPSTSKAHASKAAGQQVSVTVNIDKD